MSEAPEGLTEEERGIWRSSIPTESEYVANPELQEMGFDTRVTRHKYKLHDPKPLLVTIAALRIELAEALAEVERHTEYCQGCQTKQGDHIWALGREVGRLREACKHAADEIEGQVPSMEGGENYMKRVYWSQVAGVLRDALEPAERGEGVR